MSFAIRDPRLARWFMMSKSGRRGGWGKGFWGGSGPWAGMPMGPGHPGWGHAKVRRGDVRHAILHLLSEEPMHGYQIIQELSERTSGMWKPSAGSIYPTLQQLEDEDLIVASDETGKKVYRLTDAGRESVESDETGPPWEQFESHESYSSLRDAGFGLGAAVMQVAGSGTEEQVERTREILEEARRKVYQLLADTDATD